MEDKSGNQKKRWFTVLAVCALMIVLFQIFYSQNTSSNFTRHMELQRRNSISKIVQLSYNMIKPVIERVKNGELDISEARKLVSDVVRGMIYEDEFGSNYIFMSTYEGIMLVQPFEPYKEGTNQWNLKDEKGNYIIQELIKSAKAKPDGAFVTYYYYPPGNTQVEEKLSYIIGIPEIKAYIGTGMYIESSYHELEKVLENQRNGYVVITMVILITLMLYFRELTKSNNMLQEEIAGRKKAEEQLKNRYEELEKTKEKLQQNHDELSAIYEELTATEEELRAQYEELQKSQDETIVLAERYMLAAEGSKDVIWDWDARENGMYISHRLSELLGYSKDDLKIKGYADIYSLMHSEDREKVNRDYHMHIVNRTENYSSEFRLICKDGTYKWFHASGKSVFDKDGEVLRNAGSITDITERKKHEAKIRQLAYFDYLTGLPNRVFAVNDLKERLCNCSTDSCTGAVFFIDIDNFKVINDTFGHSYGDRVLVEVSNRLKSLSLASLTIARIGGDEFVIIQDVYKEETEIKRQAQRVLELFKDPVNIDRNYFHIACSIGIALYPSHGSTTEEILKNADMAMYKAKNWGKNRYVLYDHQMGTALTERTKFEKQLRNAFENNEFVLYYQPKYDVKKGGVVGFEALIRWNSPVYGLVLPYRFISIIEEMGFINKIGSWVIDKTFEFASTLQDRNVCVSCNVSPVQLLQNNFVDDVIAAFDRYELKKGCVAIEITESSLVESFEKTTEKLKKLRDKGILVYLDDFGTGYSSLTYLKQLPIDVVKIDKSFIDDIISGGIETRIVKTIIYLVHEIGLEVVAEGVETVEQLQYLSECECDYIQGYLISRPVPQSQAVEFV